MAERPFRKGQVGGSIPPSGSMLSWSSGQDTFLVRRESRVRISAVAPVRASSNGRALAFQANDGDSNSPARSCASIVQRLNVSLPTRRSRVRFPLDAPEIGT